MVHVALRSLMLCMDKEKRRCTKHFTNEFKEVTILNEDGYQMYHCHNAGKQYKVRDHMMDNSNVVPPVPTCY